MGDDQRFMVFGGCWFVFFIVGAHVVACVGRWEKNFSLESRGQNLCRAVLIQ